jgi:acyl-coenzyme A thioesterase PaaI-like protein
VTIGLAVDFVGTAQVGQWLAVEPEVIRTGSTICFAQSLIKADGVVIARANGTFRVVPKQGTSKNPVSEAAGSR